MNDFLYFCPTCKMIYEILRHRVRPPAEPVCDGCQQDLPVAEDGEWLTGQPALDLTTQHSVTCPPLPAALVCRGIDACFVVRDQ